MGLHRLISSDPEAEPGGDRRVLRRTSKADGE